MQLGEARVPGVSFSKNNSDLQYQHDQCECWSITKRGIFKLVLNILTHRLAVNIHIEAYSKFLNS